MGGLDSREMAPSAGAEDCSLAKKKKRRWREIHGWADGRMILINICQFDKAFNPVISASKYLRKAGIE